MINLINIDIVDSESRIFTGDIEYLVVDAYNGELGIYPHHIALITKLKPGILRMKLLDQDEQLIFAISGGFMEVSNNKIIILADILERTDALDESRLQLQKEEAYTKLKHSNSSLDHDVAKVQSSLEMAIAQLKAIEFLKKRSNRA